LGASVDEHTETFETVAGGAESPDDHPSLVVTAGPRAGTRYELDDDVVTAGRHPDSAIFLDDITVSRRHVELRRGEAGWEVADVGSLNGTYVNGTRVERHILESGDELQIGKFKLLFVQRSG
jgi:pSer/pThr/pTyr-binding forkhead associated (FHA) protein